MSDYTITSSKHMKEDQIVEYLRAHKDFFLKHSDLLAEIDLPHHSGQAVSLVEKQVAILRERNIEMRQRLSNLLENARENDRLFDRTKRLVLALLECRNLEELVSALYYSFHNEFGIHYTRLILFGSNGHKAGEARIESMQRAREYIGERLKNGKAVTGGIDIKEIQFLFDSDAPNIGSAAMVVLTRGEILGVLAIGNQDPRYYNSSMGTLFLAYIGEVLNRLLPRFL